MADDARKFKIENRAPKDKLAVGLELGSATVRLNAPRLIPPDDKTEIEEIPAFE